MFKALKWVYNRGREYERMRLKKLTAELSQAVALDQQQFRQYPVGPDGKADIDTAEKIEREVNTRVLQTLDRLIYSQPKPHDYPPEMAPPVIDSEK